MSKALNLPNLLALFRIALAPLMLWFFIDRNNPIFSSWHPSWFDYFAGLIFVIASDTNSILPINVSSSSGNIFLPFFSTITLFLLPHKYKKPFL